METKKITGILMVMFLAIALAVPLMAISVGADVDGELVFDLDSTRSDTNEEVDAGGYVDFYHRIDNLNSTDDMEVEVTVSGLISGFTYAIFNDTGIFGNDFDVPAGSTINVTVRIYAEDGLAGGLTDQFTVTATEATRELIASETLSVTVGNTYTIEHFVWDLSTPPVKVYNFSDSTPAGDYVAYQCNIKNTGNVILDVGLNLVGEASLPTGWEARIIDNLITKNVITTIDNLAPLQTEVYYVEVNTDLDANISDYGVIISQAEVIGQPTATVTQENLTLNTSVSASRVAPVWVVSGSSSQSINSGQRAIFTVDLQNDNNVDMNTVISVASLLGIGGETLTGWTVAIYDDTGSDALTYDDDDELIAEPGNPSQIFELPASDSERFYVVINTTADAIPGTANIDIYATFMSLARDNEELNLTQDVEAAPIEEPEVEEEAPMLYEFAGLSMSLVNWIIIMAMLAIVIVAGLGLVWRKMQDREIVGPEE